jgi:hypothetical protein
VEAAIAIVEDAVKASKVEVDEARQTALAKAVTDPNHSFTRQPVFAPMAAATWDVEMTFPLILRRSLFIAVCSHIEHVLHRWCDFLRAEWNLVLEPKAFAKKSKKKNKGETTSKALMRYVVEVAQVGAIANYETWPELAKLEAYWRARNCIVHDGGIVDDEPTRKILDGMEHIEVDESHLLLDVPAVVHLLPGACSDAAQTAKVFFERLTVACQLDARAPRS